MFTSFTSYEVTLLINALNASAQDSDRFPRTLRESMLELAKRLESELAKHETTPIIAPASVPLDRVHAGSRAHLEAERAVVVVVDHTDGNPGNNTLDNLQGVECPPDLATVGRALREAAIEQGRPVAELSGSPIDYADAEGMITLPFRKSAQIHRLTEVVTTPPNWEFSVECMLIGEPMWRVKAGASTHEQAMAYAEDVAREEGVCSVRIIRYQLPATPSSDPAEHLLAFLEAVRLRNPGTGAMQVADELIIDTIVQALASHESCGWQQAQCQVLGNELRRIRNGIR